MRGTVLRRGRRLQLPRRGPLHGEYRGRDGTPPLLGEPRPLSASRFKPEFLDLVAGDRHVSCSGGSGLMPATARGCGWSCTSTRTGRSSEPGCSRTIPRPPRPSSPRELRRMAGTGVDEPGHVSVTSGDGTRIVASVGGQDDPSSSCTGCRVRTSPGRGSDPISKTATPCTPCSVEVEG